MFRLVESERVLITGLNGLIGWNLYQYASGWYEAFGTYRKSHPVFQTSGNFRRINLLRGRELSDFLKEIRPDYFIHAWAMCDLDLCEQFPQMAEEINVRGLEHVLQAVSDYGRLRKFVYVSTDHVFDGRRGQYSEEDIPSPKHVYGRTKRQAEEKVLQSAIPHLLVRPGLVIGRSVQGNKGPRDFLLSRILARKPTHLFVDEYRTPIRAETLAEKVFQRMRSEAGGIVHLAGEKSCSRFELARQIASDHELPHHQIFPRKRCENKWAHIRPQFLTLWTVF